MPDWPAGVPRGPGLPVSRLLPIRVSGPVRVKDRAGPGRRSQCHEVKDLGRVSRMYRVLDTC